VSEWQTGDTQNDVNNNPGSESMTGQDWEGDTQVWSWLDSSLRSEWQLTWDENNNTGSTLIIDQDWTWDAQTWSGDKSW
jgi:hypothetical protein